MSTNQVRIAGTGVLYLLIFVSGIRLTRSGKPYSAVLLAIHKLISLAAVAWLVVTMVQTHQVIHLGSMAVAAGVVTGLFFVGTIASGGLLSTDRPMPAAIRAAHRINSALTVLSTAVTFLLIRR